MAIIPEEKFPNQITPASTQYPLGSAQNTSGIANDGTPLVASWVNDIWGFLQGTLIEGNVTASGNEDTATASQYLTALKNVMSRSTPVGSYVDSDLDEATFNAQIALGTWVLADGRDVTGTDYATIKGSNNVPDLQGRFRRMVGGNSEGVGVNQADSTATNGLSIPLGGDHSHRIANAGGDIPLIYEKTGAGSTSQYMLIQGGGTYASDRVAYAVSDTMWQNMGYGAGQNAVHTHEINGDSETAPINMAFYVYVKVSY